MQIKRTFDLLDRNLEKFPRPDALVSKVDGKWKPYSTKEYKDYADNIAYGLISLGIQPKDTVVTVSNNRPEWNFVDMGIAQSGAIHVPVYPTISVTDYIYILNHAEAKVIFVSDSKALSRIKEAVKEVPSVKYIYSFDKIEDQTNFIELYNLGKQNADKLKEELQNRKNAITSDDIATIIYTSGTTGLSKGVMLTHNNFISNFTASTNIIDLTPEDKILSVLPLCHVYERCFCYMYQYVGVGIYYAQNPASVSRDLIETGTCGCNTVPRIFESIINRIFSEARGFEGEQRKLFEAAVEHAYKFEHDEVNGPEYEAKRKFYDEHVYSHWRKNYFGNLKFIGCGGAALPMALSHLAWAAGITVQEGYGLTETSPIIAHSLRCKDGHVFSAVGPIVSNLDVKIAEDGEIVVKGPSVMKGYYKNPELTKEVFTEDGYFKTGDIGVITQKGPYKHLHITDRKKDVFKTSGGKYIAPLQLEGVFKASNYIDNIMIVGENQRFPSAVISPDFGAIKSFLESNGVNISDRQEMIIHPLVKDLFDKEVRAINRTLGKHEEVKHYSLVPDTWTAEGGQLGQTQKLRRKNVSAQYKEMLDKMREMDAN